MCDVTSVKSKPNHKSISMNGQHEEAMQYLCLHNQPQSTHQPSKAFTFFSGYILIDFTLILEKKKDKVDFVSCSFRTSSSFFLSFLPTCHVGWPCPPKLTLGLSISLLFFVALSSKRQRHHTHGKKSKHSTTPLTNRWRHHHHSSTYLIENLRQGQQYRRRHCWIIISFSLLLLLLLLIIIITARGERE